MTKTTQHVDGAPVIVETINRYDMDDTSIYTIRLAWKHRIYRTNEYTDVVIVTTIDEQVLIRENAVTPINTQDAAEGNDYLAAVVHHLLETDWRDDQ